jgi:hypothetical protein
MNDVQVMRDLQHVTELHDHAADPRRGESLVLFQQNLEAHAVDVFHDDAGSARVVERGVEQLHRVRVLQPRHRLSFALEPILEFGVVRQVLVHHLDDHEAIGVELSRQIDTAHPPFAQEALGFIPSHV